MKINRITQFKSVKSSLCGSLIAVGLIAVTSGCSTIVREMQRNESQSASSTAVVSGQTLSVMGEMWLENAKDQGEGPVRGRFVVSPPSGQLPSDIDLYHFQIMTKDWRRGLGNYQRGKDGQWRKVGRGGGAPLNVKVTREANRMILEFAFSDWKTKPQPFDVTISLSDSQGKKHTLLAANIFAEAK